MDNPWIFGEKGRIETRDSVIRLEMYRVWNELFSFMLYLYFCKRFFFYEQLGKVDESGS